MAVAKSSPIYFYSTKIWFLQIFSGANLFIAILFRVGYRGRGLLLLIASTGPLPPPPHPSLKHEQGVGGGGGGGGEQMHIGEQPLPLC